jgi:hypothetical protein
MRVRGLLLLMPVAVLGFVACSRSCKPPSSPQSDVASGSEGSLGFDIRPIAQQGETFLASYTARGKTAKFRVELGSATPSKNTDLPMSFGKGRFIAWEGKIHRRAGVGARVLPC